MSDPAPPRPPAPPVPAASPPAVVNLDPRWAAGPSAQLLSRVPWDGPALDPSVLAARAMLAWLR